MIIGSIIYICWWNTWQQRLHQSWVVAIMLSSYAMKVPPFLMGLIHSSSMTASHPWLKSKMCFTEIPLISPNYVKIYWFVTLLIINLYCTFIESTEVNAYPDSKVHGANMGPNWGRQDPGGPHVGPMNLALWECNCVFDNILFCNLCKLLIKYCF